MEVTLAHDNPGPVVLICLGHSGVARVHKVTRPLEMIVLISTNVLLTPHPALGTQLLFVPMFPVASFVAAVQMVMKAMEDLVEVSIHVGSIRHFAIHWLFVLQFKMQPYPNATAHPGIQAAVMALPVVSHFQTTDPPCVVKIHVSMVELVKQHLAPHISLVFAHWVSQDVDVKSTTMIVNMSLVKMVGHAKTKSMAIDVFAHHDSLVDGVKLKLNNAVGHFSITRVN